MMKLVTAGPDLAARFYEGAFAVLSRRDGRRAILARGRARVLRQLVDRLGLDGLLALRGERCGSEPETRALQFVDGVFAALDAAPAPTPMVALMRREPAFYQAAIRRRMPALAMLELTYRCNLRCRHCYVLDRVARRPPAQAATADLERLLPALAAAGCLDVTLTGGETTLHPDYRALVSLCKSLHLETTLKTNATTFTRERAEAYAADPAHETQASLYGATSQVHDAFTTVAGSFERALVGLRELSRAGVRCLVSCVVWSGNAEQLDALERLVQDTGHDASFSDVIHGRLNGDRAPLELRIAPQTRARLVASGRLRPFKPEACIAGTLKVKVEPDGKLSPCELVAGEGNVFTTPFEQAWRGVSFDEWSAELVRLSVAERVDGRVVRSCPAMNRLNTGCLTGLTSIG